MAITIPLHWSARLTPFLAVFCLTLPSILGAQSPDNPLLSESPLPFHYPQLGSDPE